MENHLMDESWFTFKLLLNRFRAGVPDIIHMIFMILHTEEIRERFLAGFRDQLISPIQKLDLSLDEIINPIRVLEERCHKRGCHPGRLTLDPKAYHLAFLSGSNLQPLQSENLVPGYMRAGFLTTPWGYHRLLDRSENPTPALKALLRNNNERAVWGLQGLYFLGGLPLMYWCRGETMGMKVYDGPPDSRLFQWTSNVFCPEEPALGASACGRSYCFSRMWYLPTESVWWMREFVNLTMEEFLMGSCYARLPKTWGRKVPLHLAYRNEPVGAADKSNNPYIRYMQLIEDFCKVAKYEGEEVHGLGFDEYCVWISQFSNTPQLLTIGGWEMDN